MRILSIGLLSLFLSLTHSVAALSPRETALRVDSLIMAGSGEEARPLCTGQALRLLPFLIETHQRFSAFLDTARSSNTILDEQSSGDWTGIKVRSVAVFTLPLMGMDSMTSLQAVHLLREEGVWKVADFEELSHEGAALVPRQGGLAKKRAANVQAPLLPLSHFAPVSPGATRFHLRLSTRNGDSLVLPSPSAGQKTLERSPSGSAGIPWVLIETRRLPFPDSLKKSQGVSSLYLSSTPDLDLTDQLLIARATSLKSGSPHDLETTRRIYGFVATSFNYKLGASLFGTSREALRALKGDCSEAAVLTAALLRASGIPSRVVLGFATLDRGVFIGHAWAEAWLGGEWIGVDAALREFPAGAGRVALMNLSGEQRMQPIATNLMLRTLANLDVEITAAWAGTSKLELREQRGTDKDVREFLDKVLKGMGE